MPPKATLTTVVIVLAAGAAGGYVFRLLHLPLPWTLGAMFAAAVVSFYSSRFKLPPVFRDGARPVIGVLAGSAFTPVVVGTMVHWWMLVPILTGFFLFVTSTGFLFFRIRGYDRPTALFASMPGGLGEMTLLGTQFGGDVRKLVLIHSFRIVIVVTTVPFLLEHMTSIDLSRVATVPSHVTEPLVLDWIVLVICAVAGYVLGRPLRSFGGIMIVPMVLSAFAHGMELTAAAPPVWLVASVQVVIGCITGSRFAGTKLGEARLSLLEGLFWTSILIGISFLAAYLTQFVVAMPLPALFLAFSPGGFAEMSVIAFAANIEVAFVVTCHVFRIVYVVLLGPMICNLVLGQKALE